MTPAGRAALITRAKSLATPVVSCVAARLHPGHLVRDLSRDELQALIVVLAEAADPQRLKAVTDAPGDEGAPVLSREDRLRRAHAEYQRLLRAGEAVPQRVRLLEWEYRQGNKQKRKDAAKGSHEQAA